MPRFDMEGNKPAYLHPQHTGHCLFVTRYFELNPSPMRFSLVNLFSRLGLVMAKGVRNFCVTEGRDCYARYHYSKRETSNDAEVVKYHYHTRRAEILALFTVTTSLYLSCNNRARSLSTLIAVSVSKDTPQRVKPIV